MLIPEDFFDARPQAATKIIIDKNTKMRVKWRKENFLSLKKESMMKIRLFFCFILAICSTAFSKVVADDYNHALMEEIVAIDETCIQGCVGDKIYLNPDKIIPTDQGLFLNLGNENHLFLPMVYSDASGCYIAPALKLLPTCPFCNQTYFLKCKNKECSGKKNKNK